MSLVRYFYKDFSNESRNRGATYFSQNRIRLDKYERGLIQAKVQGSQREPYSVSFNYTGFPMDVIVGKCNCPRYEDGNLCKHLWGTLLEIDRKNLKVLPAGHDMLIIHRDDMESYNDNPVPVDDEEEDDETWKSALEDIRDSHDEKFSIKPLWKEGAEISFCIDLEKTKKASKLALFFLQRIPNKQGIFGRYQNFGINEDDIFRITDPLLRQLFSILLGNQGLSYYSPYYGHSPTSEKKNIVLVSPDLQREVLSLLSSQYPLLMTTDDNLFQAVTWDSGNAWATNISFYRDEKLFKWVIEGFFKRNDEKISLETVTLLTDTLFLTKTRVLSVIDPGRYLPWIKILNSRGCIEIPFKSQNKFIESLYTLQGPMALPLPDELRLEEIRTTPVPHISFKPTGYESVKETELAVDVSFQYQDHEFPFQSPENSRIRSEDKKVIVRDLTKEKEYLQWLPQLGFKKPYSYLDGQCDFLLHRKSLLKSVASLVRNGWEISLEGMKIRRGGELKYTISSEIDWFELNGNVTFDDLAVPFLKLIEALKKNQDFIELEDGTLALIPKEWKEEIRPLIALGKDSAEGLRYSKTQASLLSAMMEKKEVIADLDFTNFVKKLEGFEGIRTAVQPSGFIGKMRPYQKEGLGWLHFLQEFGFGGCLADEMGLGKTIQILSLLEERRLSRENPLPSLVVVPRSLVYNWLDEAKKFTPSLKIIDFTNSQRGTLEPASHDQDLIVMTYGTVRRDIQELVKLKFDYVILDESQAIKNSQSQVSQAVKLLSANHRLAMTGTPVENHLGELWSLFEFLNPSLLGLASGFKDLVSRTSQKSNSSEETIRHLAKGLKPYLLRRTKKQVLKELPDKTEQTIFCEMETEQKKLYGELKDYYRTQLTQRIVKEGLNKSKIQVLEALLRLRQAACHPALIDKKYAAVSSTKLQTLSEQLKEILESGHKVLIFSQFTKMLALVKTLLDKEKIVYEYLDGATRDRKTRVDHFQTDLKCPVFLISLKAGGFGLNLTAADYVFILDPWWNPAVETQAIDRAHRIGQQKSVTAYRLIVKETVEEKILELQKRKKDLAEAVISESTSILRALTQEDLLYLLG